MRAPSPTPYTIFFSHKRRDESAVRAIINIIYHGTENIRCFTSENIEKGIDWRKTLAENLKRASALVLVFTDPEEDWGWVLYETGFFDSLTEDPGPKNSRRIYSLHPPAVAPPSPIADLQSVPTTLDAVSAWLRDLFSYTNQPQRFCDHIPRIASEICDLFGERKPRSAVLVPTMTILLKDSTTQSEESLLSSEIEADTYALTLFNLRPGYSKWTLGDIKRAQTDRLWFNELINNVVTVSNGQNTTPARHVLRTNHGDFVPKISRLVRETDTELTLTVDLVELPKEAKPEAFFGLPIPSNRWPQVFVAMPFLKEIDPIYRDHITEVVKNKLTKTLGRADDFYSIHEIMKDVWSAIYYSEVVIADCTGRNPNVFYEIGIAHTLGKKTVLIAQQMDDIPFDVRHIRNIIYEYTPRGVRQFEKTLEETLRVLFDQSP
jgi:hypothetical protein